MKNLITLTDWNTGAPISIVVSKISAIGENRINKDQPHTDVWTTGDGDPFAVREPADEVEETVERMLDDRLRR